MRLCRLVAALSSVDMNERCTGCGWWTRKIFFFVEMGYLQKVRGAGRQSGSHETSDHPREAEAQVMSFYLISEGLTCLGMFNGAYESLKVLSRAEKGIEVSTLTQILEFWIALGALTIFEEYAEFFVSWIPFYYFFKCMLLGLLLVPSTKISHVLYHGFIEPTMDKIQEQVHARVLPVVESLVVQHGHWFHERLLSRSLTLLDDQALNEYERELQRKLQDVRNEVRERRQRTGKEHSEAK